MSNALYATALALALVSEIPIVWLGYRRTGVSTRRIVTVTFAVNLLTHGTLWAIWPFLSGPYWTIATSAEVSVCLVETVCYCLLFGSSVRRALAVSVLANASSMMLGFICFGSR